MVGGSGRMGTLVLRALAAGAVPLSVVRSTEWYGFADQVYPSVRMGDRRFGLAPAMRMQPVAAGAVAVRLADAALNPVPGPRVALAGPEVMARPDPPGLARPGAAGQGRASADSRAEGLHGRRSAAGPRRRDRPDHDRAVGGELVLAPPLVELR